MGCPMKLSLRACSMIAFVACGCLLASSREKITEVEFVDEVLARQTALECRYVFECPDLAFDLLLIAGRHATLDA